MDVAEISEGLNGEKSGTHVKVGLGNYKPWTRRCSNLSVKMESYLRDLEPTVSVVPSGKPEMRANSNEVNIQTLISSTILAQTVASKVFEIDPPALLVRRVSCKIIHCAGRPPADGSDILSNFGR